MDTSLFEWKVTHVVASLDVNLKTSVLRYALVVHIHEFAESKRRYGAAYAEGDEAQPNQKSAVVPEVYRTYTNPIWSSLNPYISWN